MDSVRAADKPVVVWGEMGRTPRVNKNGGRDHWSQVAGCCLAGGGMKTGQVVGKSTKNAERPLDRPVHMQEVFAPLYHNMGIDINKATLPDLSGRPQFLIDTAHQPLPEVI